MRSYYKVVQLLRDLLEANEDVNTIVHSARSQADLQKKNIYPLVVINPLSASLDNGQVNEFVFEIAALDQRDLSDDEILDKFIGNDNEIDNLNLCHSILNKLVTELRLLNNDEGVELTDATNLTPILFSDKNILDGWTLNLTIEIPNTNISACD